MEATLLSVRLVRDHLTFKLRFICVALLAATFITVAHAEHLPRPDHVVVVIEENRGYGQIMDKLNSSSYIHALSKRGMLFTQSYGVSHPSQPNYLALFSGSTQRVTNNTCGYSFTSDNLATELLSKGLSFTSYAESLPEAGDLTCMSGAYQRKHNPVTNWQGTRLLAEMNLPFSDFPQDFSKLPTVSFVIPNLSNDMHDGSLEAADIWLKKHIDPYVEWAFKNNSLLILTWDEDDLKQNNQIVTLFVGPMVKVGINSERINHYSVLTTILDFYGLPAVGLSQSSNAINGVWLAH